MTLRDLLGGELVRRYDSMEYAEEGVELACEVLEKNGIEFRITHVKYLNCFMFEICGKLPRTVTFKYPPQT